MSSPYTSPKQVSRNDSDARIWAIVAAGGSGQRFSNVPGNDKLLADLAGLPVLIRTLTALLAAPSIKGVVVVASQANKPRYDALIQDSPLKDAPIQWATGGADRQASVLNGLMAVPKKATHVAVHDAARPLIEAESIERVIHAATGSDVVGAILALPVVDTLKQVAPDTQASAMAGNEITQAIIRTLDRRALWRAQTPQVFDKEILLAAHQQYLSRKQEPSLEITDDAQLVELAGLGKVVTVPGSASNIKITMPEDLALATALLHLKK